jgi:hypothetical protein
MIGFRLRLGGRDRWREGRGGLELVVIHGAVGCVIQSRLIKVAVILRKRAAGSTLRRRRRVGGPRDLNLDINLPRAVLLDDGRNFSRRAAIGTRRDFKRGLFNPVLAFSHECHLSA